MNKPNKLYYTTVDTSIEQKNTTLCTKGALIADKKILMAPLA